jgi:apolipoprotein N-acyltransferase
LNLRALSFVDRCAATLKDAQGLRRVLLAATLGALGALAFEPIRAFPLLLVAYAGLVLLFDGASTGPKRMLKGALAGWGFGFGFFFVGLHWVGYAFLVDAAAHAWQLPFVMVLFPGGLALFFAAAGMVCMLAWRPGVQRLFLFALALFAAEWLRGHILTGFPWNIPGYGWAASLAVLQSASIIGAYGLSLLTLLFGASLAALIGDARGRRTPWLPAGVTLLFVGLWVAGEVRLLNGTEAAVPNVHLRLVQPDTPQTEKFQPQYVNRNWRRLIDLSNEPAAVAPTHIIWPEAAAPFSIALSPSALAEIAQLTGDSRVLLTGDVRFLGASGQPQRAYNSFDIFGPHGNLLNVYDKFHLVPFGEYLPLEPVLRAVGFTEIAADTGFSSGSGPQTLTVPGAPPAGPLICYEVIFPQAVTAEPRPEWLVNVTDDSWFGPNVGPMQHLLIARVRAIEEGLPITRAANSGISAVIDSYGRIRAELALGLRGVIDSELPVALSATLFARYGTLIILALFLLCATAALWPVSPSRA